MNCCCWFGVQKNCWKKFTEMKNHTQIKLFGKDFITPRMEFAHVVGVHKELLQANLLLTFCNFYLGIIPSNFEFRRTLFHPFIKLFYKLLLTSIAAVLKHWCVYCFIVGSLLVIFVILMQLMMLHEASLESVEWM